MKINFPPPTDGQRHRYCQNCLSEKVRDVKIGNKILYQCDNCGKRYDRLIDFNPEYKWWVDKKTRELWHETVGVLVVRPDKKFLFIERTIYPQGYLTIPSGHLGAKEKPYPAALRELREETGIKTKKINFLTKEDIKDPCRPGADYHRWHLYTFLLRKKQKIIPDKGEGCRPTWLTIDQALKKKLTKPVRYFLERYKNQIIDSVAL